MQKQPQKQKGMENEGQQRVTGIETQRPVSAWRLWRLWGLLCLGLLVSGWSCGAGFAEGAPIIREFKFVGQRPENKQLFLFQMQWEDREGDVRSLEKPTKIIFTLEVLDPDKRQTLTINYEIPKRRPEDPPATSGVFPALALQLSEEPGKYPKLMKITAVLEDALGNRSNQPWVMLQAP